MANYCANELIVTGDNVNQFAEYAKGIGVIWHPASYELEYLTKELKRQASVKDYIEYEYNRKTKNPDLLDLFKFVPLPNMEPGYYSYSEFGYTWAIGNHGTKWGCYNIIIPHQDENKIIYHFNTAWSPFGYKVFQVMCDKFPQLEFKLNFFEFGCMKAGYYDKDGSGSFDFQDSDFPQCLTTSQEESEEYYHNVIMTLSEHWELDPMVASG